MCIGSGFFSGSYGARHSALSVGLLDEVVLPKEETSILGVLSPQMFSNLENICGSLYQWKYCYFHWYLVTSGNSNTFSLRD